MNSVISINITRFIVLLLAQVFICSNINFLGYINPYVYVIFILLFPVKNNRLIFLTTAFLYGLLLDMLLDSGGVHAASSVFLAYARPVFLKFAFGTLYDNQTIKFTSLEFSKLLIYVITTVIAHHLLLFSLEIFNISQILIILKKTLFSSIFTIVLSLLLMLLFKTRK